MINVIKFTFKELIKNKSYKLTTLFLVAITIIAFNIPNISNYFNKSNKANTDKNKIVNKQKVYIYDEFKVLNDINNDLNKHPVYKFEIKNEKADLNELSKNVNDKKEVIYIVKEVKNYNITIAGLKNQNNTFSTYTTDIEQYINSSYKKHLINKLNISDNEKQLLSNDISFITENTIKNNGDINKNANIAMFGMVFIFYIVLFYSIAVGTSITTEKTNKVVETLLTSTSPLNIIVGKVIGVGLTGILQMSIVIVTAIISSQIFLPKEYMTILLQNINLSPVIILGFLYYFIFGFLIYAFLIACVGATVTKQEEVQQAQAPFSFLLIIGFYLSIFGSNSKGILNTIATYLPISSPFINTMNLLSRKLSMIDIILPMLVLLIFTAIVAYISSIIYKKVIMNYGTRIKGMALLKELFRKED
jgi:ABC-type Na+ efflux pump, permease component